MYPPCLSFSRYHGLPSLRFIPFTALPLNAFYSFVSSVPFLVLAMPSLFQTSHERGAFKRNKTGEHTRRATDHCNEKHQTCKRKELERVQVTQRNNTPGVPPSQANLTNHSLSCSPAFGTTRPFLAIQSPLSFLSLSLVIGKLNGTSSSSFSNPPSRLDDASACRSASATEAPRKNGGSPTPLLEWIDVSVGHSASRKSLTLNRCGMSLNPGIL